MDTYYKKETTPQNQSDVFLTGVTCMFISSKFEDRLPFTMQRMIEDIAHHTLEIAEIKAKEKRMMSLFDYNMPEASQTSFLDFAIACYFKKDNLEDEMTNNIQKMCLFLFKMCCFSYEFLGYSSGFIGVCTFALCIKKMGLENGAVLKWVC